MSSPAALTRRLALILGLLGALVILGFVAHVAVQEHGFTANRRIGKLCTQRVRTMLAADGKVQDISVEGYNVHGGLLRAADYFYVSGFVTSKTDLVDLERTVNPIELPGRLCFLVTVKARSDER